jgi:hypothetical protein
MKQVFKLKWDQFLDLPPLYLDPTDLLGPGTLVLESYSRLLGGIWELILHPFTPICGPIKLLGICAPV